MSTVTNLPPDVLPPDCEDGEPEWELIGAVGSGRFRLEEKRNGAYVNLLWEPDGELYWTESMGSLMNVMRAFRGIEKGWKGCRGPFQPREQKYSTDWFICSLVPGRYRLVCNAQHLEWMDMSAHVMARPRFEQEVFDAVTRPKAEQSKIERVRFRPKRV
jgi:hypothetical protein